MNNVVRRQQEELLANLFSLFLSLVVAFLVVLWLVRVDCSRLFSLSLSVQMRARIVNSGNNFDRIKATEARVWRNLSTGTALDERQRATL